MLGPFQMQLNCLQTLFQPVPHRAVRIIVMSVSLLANMLESTFIEDV